ncbi:MAG TPA: MIP/aquaporin family protein [Micromonosporaceae bacterium]|nr:MIP/aquaporin family protein [Micromonosporaceae bacterium]
MAVDLTRRAVAEGLGTAGLLAAVVGSGIMGERLAGGNLAVALLANSLATGGALLAIISALQPISGAHLNPLVSAADWVLGRAGRDGPPGRHLTAYALVQVVAAVGGALLANAMFDVPAGCATTDRSDWRLWLGEVVATAGLVTLVFALARTGRHALAGPAVGAYIGAAYWFTSSTSFANPAVTVGRMVTDSFTGIAPSSVLPFVAAQVLGAAVGVVLVRVLYPYVAEPAGHPVAPLAPDLVDSTGGPA